VTSIVLSVADGSAVQFTSFLCMVPLYKSSQVHLLFLFRLTGSMHTIYCLGWMQYDTLQKCVIVSAGNRSVHCKHALLLRLISVQHTVHMRYCLGRQQFNIFVNMHYCLGRQQYSTLQTSVYV
jgi:hypothetical protein